MKNQDNLKSNLPLNNSFNELVKNILIVLRNNKDNYIETDLCCIHWDGNLWVVSIYNEQTTEINNYEYMKEELEKAVKKFVELTWNDRITKTDEEVDAILYD